MINTILTYLYEKFVAVQHSVGDTVYYQGMKLVVVEVSGSFITAVTPDTHEGEPTYHTDDYRMFVKV
jgi:hypothetical protein